MKNAIKSVCILTLGCPKNIVDSEYLMTALKQWKENIIFVEDARTADLVLLNTCGFKGDAIDESYLYIKQLHKYAAGEIVVFGCLISRQKKELEQAFGDKIKFCSVLSTGELLDYLALNFTPFRTELLTPLHYSYLKISDGCDRHCAFCAIPQIKGAYQSVHEQKLINEAKFITQNGVKELILIAQETTNYGKDFTNKGFDFSTLLRNLSKINDLKRIRIMYAHPNSFNAEVLDIIRDTENICRYIDMPLQHISDDILTKMQRHTPSSKIKQVIENARVTISELAIRSTFIVGFPGETDADFQKLYDFLAEYKLERVGVFVYSEEDGTPAMNLPNKIPKHIKEERFAALMELQQKISLDRNKSFIGKTLSVLIDSKTKEGFHIGRTEFDAPEIDNTVIVQNRKNIKIGDFVDLKITAAQEYDLIAT